MVVSPERLAANRANAQKSTGPKTPDGKQRSSRNAATHGFWAEFLLPSESAAAFRALRDSMILSLNPQTPLELDLVHRAATLAWRLRRLQNAETGLLLTLEADLARAFRDHDAAYHAAPPDQRDPTKALPEHLDLDHPIPPGFAAAQLFKSPDNPLERLTRTEHRLQGMYHRTLRQLADLQKAREQNPDAPVSPYYQPEDEYEDDEAGQEQEAPNEPTDPAEEEELQNEPTDPTNEKEKVQNEPTGPTSTPPPTEKAQNEPTEPTAREEKLQNEPIPKASPSLRQAVDHAVRQFLRHP